MTTLIARVSRIIPSLYLPTGYHVVEHAFHVYDRCIQFINRLRRYGISITREDEEEILLAALLHDMLFGLSPTDYFIEEEGRFRPSSSKEETSKVAGIKLLLRQGVPIERAQRIGEIVMGTHPLSPLTSTGQMVLAAADLDIAGPLDQFRRGTETLRREAAMLQGRRFISREQFLRGSVNYLALYLTRMIAMTPEAWTSEGQSEFHLRAVGNIVGSLRQIYTGDRALVTIGELGCGKSPIIADPGTDVPVNSLYIGIDRQSEVLLPALTQIKQTAVATKRVVPMALALPGAERAISLPGDSLDRFFLRNTFVRHLERPSSRFDLNEVYRVLRPNGVLEVIENYQSDGNMYDQRSDRALRDVTRRRFTETGLAYQGEMSVGGGWGLVFTKT